MVLKFELPQMRTRRVTEAAWPEVVQEVKPPRPLFEEPPWEARLLPPPSLRLGTLVLPGTHSACQEPSPQPGTRGLPQPWPRAARGNKGPVSACSGPHPLARPWHRGTRAGGSTRLFAEAVRSPRPSPAGLLTAPVFPHSRDGQAERGKELVATSLGLESRSLCLKLDSSAGSL